MTQEWVNGPDVLDRLDFFEPGYFFVYEDGLKTPSLVEVTPKLLVRFAASMYQQFPNKYMSQEFWWAKVHFPVFDKQGK